MAGNKGRCQLIEVLTRPAEMKGSGPDSRARIGDTTTQDNIGVVFESLYNAPGSQITLSIDRVQFPIRNGVV